MWHSQDPAVLHKNTMDMASSLLGCGLDPDKCILFQQSRVPEHTELSWILGCLCTMPALARLPQFREKSSTLKEVPLGLYVYPVLQSADILLYKGTDVPVGDDQQQNVQVAQKLSEVSKLITMIHIHHVIIVNASRNYRNLMTALVCSSRARKSSL